MAKLPFLSFVGGSLPVPDKSEIQVVPLSIDPEVSTSSGPDSQRRSTSSLDLAGRKDSDDSQDAKRYQHRPNCPGGARSLKLWFIAVLFVVRFGRLFRVNSSVNCVRPRQMGMVSRFLVLSSFVMLRCFTIMASSVGVMFLCFLVVFASILRHFAFPPYHFLKVFL